MKHILTIIAVVLLLGACAPDDQMFDVSALSGRHKLIFAKAAADLNERYPERANFKVGDGRSYVRYGDADQGDACNGRRIHACTTPINLPSLHWEILIERNYADDVVLMTHELCHVLGFDHDSGNPLTGSC